MFVNIFHSKILTVLCCLAKHLNHTTFKSRYFAVTIDNINNPFPIRWLYSWFSEGFFWVWVYLFLNNFVLSFLSRSESKAKRTVLVLWKSGFKSLSGLTWLQTKLEWSKKIVKLTVANLSPFLCMLELLVNLFLCSSCTLLLSFFQFSQMLRSSFHIPSFGTKHDIKCHSPPALRSLCHSSYWRKRIYSVPNFFLLLWKWNSFFLQDLPSWNFFALYAELYEKIKSSK